MLLKVRSLLKSKVLANDGEVGSLVDLYFDDTRWAARYLVVETGRWLERKRVLVSPASLHRDRGEIGVVHADLSKEQIRSCPDVESDQPVSRLYEAAHARHYGYSGYWTGPMLWGAMPYPGVMAPLPMPVAEQDLPPAEREAARVAVAEAERTHLRSALEVLRYRIEGSDGDAGDLDDLAIDDQDWSIRYLVIDTRRWWPGGQVMVEPTAVEAIDYTGAQLRLRLSKEALRAAPAVD